MCGIVGVLNLTDHPPAEETTLRRMLGAIRHRGPDQFGIYLDNQIGLGSARLSIIDLSTGQQPIANEDQTLWIVFNGEIFKWENKAERELLARTDLTQFARFLEARTDITGQGTLWPIYYNVY